MPEDGKLHPPSYDPNKSEIPKTQSRFTGGVEIQISGRLDPILAKIVNGKVELPKEIKTLPLKAGESLYLTIRVRVPTNSTGPQALEITSVPTATKK